MSGLWIKIAAGLACLAIGATAGYAAHSGGNASGVTPATAEAAKRPVEVRTVTIRRTVRVVRHEKPRHRRRTPTAPVVATPQRSASAAPPPRSVPAAAPSAPRPVAPAPIHNTAPVRTRTSGASGHSGSGDDGGEHEDGGGSDD